MTKKSFLKSYAFSFILLVAISIGSIIGVFLKKDAVMLKPFGDVFLNLLFTVVVPLVFFSLSSAVAQMKDIARLGKIMGWMLVVFTATGIVASLVMVTAVVWYPPAQGVHIALPAGFHADQVKVSEQIVKALTVSDFSDLWSKKNMLALIIFAILIGLCALLTGEKGKPFTAFLVSANEVMTKAVSLIMFYAPVGLGAYFAYLVGVFGPQLLGTYARAVTVYYPVALLYFFAAFSFYAYLAAGFVGIKTFWRNIIPVSLTAWATGSSLAAIPSNLEAADKSGVPQDIREIIIPMGATIHMEGSCLSAILKIVLLFGLFHMNFGGVATITLAVGIALLSGTVMAGIPGGGFLGELLIVMLYGFPIEALPIISMVGTLVDPPATMVNAVGDNVSCMMVSRILGGQHWIKMVH
ncbi:MAG: dicarboxylate/amino acid:cation symporter [Candidatus Omnitrophica bacterium]|nr:dicarboxylate/amino acid:cation symporter [Candidatus Omnitrophota bacterium]